MLGLKLIHFSNRGPSCHLRICEFDLYMTLTFDPWIWPWLVKAKFLNISEMGGPINSERKVLGQAIMSSDKASFHLIVQWTKLFEVTKWLCMQQKVDLLAPDLNS